MRDQQASRTAVLVCQGRAAAHQRIAPDRFRDPTARTMLREGELVPVEQVRAGTPPRGWSRRVEFEMVRASAEVIVPRTIAIDEAVRVRPAPQLVILGAGLDGRAWRMAELATVDVFEVDHPASQQDKRARVAGLQPLTRSLRYVPVDFTRDRLDVALASAGFEQSVATTWLWEGVVPYLSKADVTATVAVLARHSAPGSRLVVNYQTPSPSAVIGRLAARTMTALARQPSLWRSEPRRSSWTPNAMRDLLTRHGFTITSDDDLLTLAEQLTIPVRQRRSLRHGRVATARISMPQARDRR
jgi:methyltransferase (TIGR00027 family)